MQKDSSSVSYKICILVFLIHLFKKSAATTVGSTVAALSKNAMGLTLANQAVGLLPTFWKKYSLPSFFLLKVQFYDIDWVPLKLFPTSCPLQGTNPSQLLEETGGASQEYFPTFSLINFQNCLTYNYLVSFFSF